MLIREAKNLAEKPIPNITILSTAVDGNMFHWQVSILGPKNSVYDGGVYKLDITFLFDYPFKMPKIRILTKIYHPNVYEANWPDIGEAGIFCLDNLDDFSWSEVMSKGLARGADVLPMDYVLRAILNSLMNPKVHDNVFPRCFTGKVHFAANGRQITDSRHWDEDDKKTAREWAIRYAGAPEKKRPKNARKFVKSKFVFKTIHKLTAF